MKSEVQLLPGSLLAPTDQRKQPVSACGIRWAAIYRIKNSYLVTVACHGCCSKSPHGPVWAPPGSENGPERTIDDLVLAVNEVPTIGGMGDGAVQESAVKLRTGRVTPPASAGAEVQLEPDHPSLRASQGPPPTGQRV
jgi:hypothetical protein